jgi:hypothetical protein
VKSSNFDLEKMIAAEKLEINKNFTPCDTAEGDELYPNGIFVFNITKMIEYIERNQDEIELIEATVADFPEEFSSINEAHLDSVDVSIPVILAEISPGHYNLIDGNHRMQKAREMGISHLRAYRLSVKQSIQFLTAKKTYLSYVDYWNGKLK